MDELVRMKQIVISRHDGVSSYDLSGVVAAAVVCFNMLKRKLI